MKRFLPVVILACLLAGCDRGGQAPAAPEPSSPIRASLERMADQVHILGNVDPATEGRIRTVIATLDRKGPAVFRDAPTLYAAKAWGGSSFGGPYKFQIFALVPTGDPPTIELLNPAGETIQSIKNPPHAFSPKDESAAVGIFSAAVLLSPPESTLPDAADGVIDDFPIVTLPKDWQSMALAVRLRFGAALTSNSIPLWVSSEP